MPLTPDQMKAAYLAEPLQAELATLRAENERLREALKPFAEVDDLCSTHSCGPIQAILDYTLLDTLEPYAAARAALEPYHRQHKGGG